MRKKLSLIVGVTLVALMTCSIWAYASSPIKIYLDGKELKSDVPAQSINGRTMVPLRLIGEALGVGIEWDGSRNAVLITSKQGSQQDTSQTVTSKGLSKSAPVPMGESVSTPDGFTAKVASITDGNRAWDIIKATNQFNEAPATGYRYAIVGITVTNNKSAQEPAYISGADFALVGSSNVVFRSFDKSVVMPSEGVLKDLRGQLYHGGTLTGALCFYIPNNETNLVLIWDKVLGGNDKRYFEVK